MENSINSITGNRAERETPNIREPEDDFRLNRSRPAGSFSHAQERYKVKKPKSDMLTAVILSLLLHAVLFSVVALIAGSRDPLAPPASGVPLSVSLELEPSGQGRVIPHNMPPAGAKPEPREAGEPEGSTFSEPAGLPADEPSQAPAEEPSGRSLEPEAGLAAEPPAGETAEGHMAGPAEGQPTDPAAGPAAGENPESAPSTAVDTSPQFLIGSFLEREIRKRLLYPAAARKMNAQGTVVVTVYITAEGDLKNLSLAASSGNGILDSNALKLIGSIFPVPYRPGEDLSITVRVVYRLT